MAIKKQHIVIIILLILIIFVLGIIIGNLLSTKQINIVNKYIRDSELNTESFLIEQSLIENTNQSCNLFNLRLNALSDDLWQLGGILGKETAENDLGKDNYNLLKRKFHLMQIKTFLTYSKLNKNCQLKGPVILFYFKQKDNDSGEQGRILDKVVSNFNATIFAIEYNYSEELEFLEKHYNVEITPTLIINFNIKKEGLTSYEDIEKLLK